MSETLEAAWSLRLNQRNEECLSVYLRLKREGFSQTTASAIQKANFELLGASLARAQKDNEKSKLILAQVERDLACAGIQGSYYLHLEKGLQSLIAGEHLDAMTDFTIAAQTREATANPERRALALLNVLLCRENLRLPYEHTLLDLRQTLKELDSLSVEGVRQQLLAFEMRIQLRTGDFSFLEESLPLDGAVTQAHYLQLWSRSLPFHGRHRETSQEEIAWFSAHYATLYQGAYRLRTLIGVLHPQDFKVDRLSESVDRIYLWTWKWLTGSSKFSVTKVLNILKTVSLDSDQHRLTGEDRQLLRNALMWISLLSGASQPMIQRLLEKVQEPGSQDSPLFDFEYTLIAYLIALRDQQTDLSSEYFQALQTNALVSASGLQFVSIALAVNSRDPGVVPTHLRELVTNVIAMLPGAVQSGVCRYVVDLVGFSLEHAERKQVWRSAPMCKAVQLFKMRPQISCAEFASLVFGITKYDGFVHDRNIYNLLARMKGIFGADLRLRVKAGMIVSEGSWELFEIRKAPAAIEQIAMHPAWTQFCESVHSPSESLVTGEVLTSVFLDRPPAQLRGKWVSRREIETCTARPRSTINRVIVQWEKNKLIQRKGSGRLTRYRVVESREKRL